MRAALASDPKVCSTFGSDPLQLAASQSKEFVSLFGEEFSALNEEFLIANYTP